MTTTTDNTMTMQENIENMIPADMVTQETLIALIVVAVVIFLVGFFIGKTTSAQGGKQGKARKQAEKELQQYKESVNEHFGKTADLIDDMTQSYKAIFDHLSSSAQELLSQDQVQAHIASRADKAVTLTYTAEDQTNKNADTESITQNDADSTDTLKDNQKSLAKKASDAVGANATDTEEPALTGKEKGDDILAEIASKMEGINTEKK